MKSEVAAVLALAALGVTAVATPGGASSGTAQAAEARQSGGPAHNALDRLYDRWLRTAQEARATVPGGWSRGNGTGGYPSRAGWTNARFRRAAAKKRNRAANRRAHR